MKALTLALTLSIAAASGSTLAATHDHDMSQHQMATQPASQANPEGMGVVKEVDAKGGRIKIAHGPINALHWPPMTMWFALHGTLPQDIKAGDSVRFELMEAEKDLWVIVKIVRK